MFQPLTIEAKGIASMHYTLVETPTASSRDAALGCTRVAVLSDDLLSAIISNKIFTLTLGPAVLVTHFLR